MRKTHMIVGTPKAMYSSVLAAEEVIQVLRRSRFAVVIWRVGILCLYAMLVCRSGPSCLSQSSSLSCIAQDVQTMWLVVAVC